MVESGTLLRCYTSNRIEGSNPSLSAMNILIENILIAIIGAMLVGLILIVARDMIKALFNIKKEGN